MIAYVVGGEAMQIRQITRNNSARLFFDVSQDEIITKLSFFKDAAFLLTIGSFLLTVELFYIQL